MYYVMSNIHGNKQKLELMLKLINFNEKKDYLYVLGDTVDYGKDGIDILLDFSMRPNVYHLLGEHEAKAWRLISEFTRLSESGEAPDAEFIAEFRKWTMEEGGMPTFEAFSRLNSDMKEGILEYFEDMFPYDEVTADKKKYFLCHAGIAGFRVDQELDEYDDEDFYTFPLDFKKEYFNDKIIVVGHASTTEFNNGQIYKTSRAINVDCGCAFDGKLGCLCLDTGREFYV